MPKTKVWAMRNTGHAGGMWFEKIINAQPGMRCYAEPLHPRHDNEVTLGQNRGIGRFLTDERKRGHWRSLGVIKPLDGAVLAWCSVVGHVVQVVRNPIPVIGWKVGQFWTMAQEGLPEHLYNHMEIMADALGRPVKDEEDHFEAYVYHMARSVYRPMLADRRKWYLFKLEDLNYSLATDRWLFRRFMEYMTQVEWSDEAACGIRDNMPASKDSDETVLEWDCYRHGSAWSYDPSLFLVWQAWSESRRQVFQNVFGNIMLELSYGWPEVKL